MKKVTSISLVILLVAAMLHISIATHYCGGKDIASRVSMTGRLATCGMESSENKITIPGCSFTNHCCDDVVTFCGTDNNYVPSFSFVPESFQNNFQIWAIPLELIGHSFSGLIPLYTDVGPSGVLMSTSVDLCDICVFRI
jgi:hypothetical protein